MADGTKAPRTRRSISKARLYKEVTKEVKARGLGDHDTIGELLEKLGAEVIEEATS